MSTLDPQEQDALMEARARGYYVRSGRTLRALRAWIAWCRANRRPAVVVVIGGRQASIEVDGAKRWAGPVDEAEQEARRIVAEQQQVAAVGAPAVLF